MKILIADDDLLIRRLLARTLQDWGHEIVAACDGEAAWNVLLQDDAPKLAILDWMMPALDGLQLCRRLQTLKRAEPTYVILLTARRGKEDIVAGLDGGANDFIAKPFDRKELQARIRVGERMILLQHRLAERVTSLEGALAQVKQLQGLLPICGYCKNVRDDQNYWRRVDDYLTAHSEVRFSHGVCPDCYRKVVMPEFAADGVVLDDDVTPPIAE